MRTGAMRKCENLLLYGRKRRFSTIGSMTLWKKEEILYNWKHEKYYNKDENQEL